MADVQSKKRRPNFSDEELHDPLHSEIPPLLVITFVYLTSKRKENQCWNMRKCNMVWNEQYMAAIVSYLSYDEYASILEFVVIWKIVDFRC